MSQGEPFRLHIGGAHPYPGWKLLNIQPGPGVDYLGSATDLSSIPSGVVDEVYGSHIYEHLSYGTEVLPAMQEAYRVLKPGGIFKVAVPDLEMLCRLFLTDELTVEDKFKVMRMIYGGQTDPFDYHKVGYSPEILAQYMHAAGFRDMERVGSFGLFPDTSEKSFAGVSISLNVQGRKPLA